MKFKRALPVDQVEEHWNRLFSHELSKGISLKTGVVALLEQLRSDDIPCAVATSTMTNRAQEHLEKAGIAKYFQALVR